MIEVITGPMFSGKSKLLIDKYNAIKDKDTVLLFKSTKDTRNKSKIKSRCYKKELEAIGIKTFSDIVNEVVSHPKVHTIFIDEAQFITGNWKILKALSLYYDIDIYIVGLNMTSDLEPFGCIPFILSIANNIITLKSKCKCGRDAYYTKCNIHKDSDIKVGDSDIYEPVCRNCLLGYEHEIPSLTEFENR